VQLEKKYAIAHSYAILMCTNHDASDPSRVGCKLILNPPRTSKRDIDNITFVDKQGDLLVFR
jgi:hypothetical protein